MEEDIRIFFRHCPACGRRFEIHLVSKEKVSETDSSTRLMPRILSAGGLMLRSYLYPSMQPAGQSVLKNTVEPTVIDSTEFEYTYECGHCGHVWHEIRLEDAKIILPHGGAGEVLEQSQDGATPEEEREDEDADQS